MAETCRAQPTVTTVPYVTLLTNLHVILTMLSRSSIHSHRRHGPPLRTVAPAQFDNRHIVVNDRGRQTL